MAGILELVKIEITKQGAPVTDFAYVVNKGDDILALSIEMKSKYCRVGYFGSNDDVPHVSIRADEYSIRLHEDHPPGKDTEVSFPDHKGWTVHSAACGRYTFNVCLVKKG